MATLILFLAAVAAPVVAFDGKFFEGKIESIKQEVDMPSGAAVAIVDNRGVVYEGYFGFADIEAEIPVRQNTHFYIASTTKAFLSLATLLAEHRGDIKESTTLAQLFPKTKFKVIDPELITVRHLLSHTSGIDNLAFTWAASYSGQHNAVLRKEFVASLYPDADSKLGEHRYTNLGYNVMSVWFDEYYGRDWRVTLDALVLSPLGMDDTSGFISDVGKNDWSFAQPYSYKYKEGKKQVYLRKDDSTMYSIGLVSTTRDVARFVTAQINNGIVDGKRIFPAEVIKKSHVKQADANSYYSGYAWGWQLADFKETREIFHTGGFVGASALISFLPEKDIGIVVLQNESGLKANYLGSLIKDMAYSLMLGEKPQSLGKRLNSQVADFASRVGQAETDLASEIEKKSKQRWHLSVEKEKYSGTYSNELAGEVTITSAGDTGMEATWGNLWGKAFAHPEPDKIDINFRPGAYYTAEFNVQDGEVNELIVNGFTFVKQ